MNLMALFILLLCFSLSIQLDKYEYFLSHIATDLVGTCVHVKGGTAKTGLAGQFAMYKPCTSTVVLALVGLSELKFCKLHTN